MSIYFLYYHWCGVLFRRYLIAADLVGNREVIPELCYLSHLFFMTHLNCKLIKLTYCYFVNDSQYLFYIIFLVNVRWRDIVFIMKMNVLIVIPSPHIYKCNLGICVLKDKSVIIVKKLALNFAKKTISFSRLPKDSLSRLKVSNDVVLINN